MSMDHALNSEAISSDSETTEDCVASESPAMEDCVASESPSTEAAGADADIPSDSEPEPEALASAPAESPETEGVAPRPKSERLALLPLLEHGREIPALDVTHPKPRRDFALKGAAAVVAVFLLAGAGAGAIHQSLGQSALLATQARENEQLVSTVANLRERLDALEAARAHDETAEIRKVVGELKTQGSATHDVAAAIGQLSTRVERVERDQGTHLDKIGERMDHEASSHFADLAARIDKLEKKAAPAAPAKADEFSAPIAQLTGRLDRVERDESARLDKLADRIEHETTSRFTDLAARMDKLEKKPAGPAVASLAPAPKPAPVAANISNETTGSIEKQKLPMRGYMVVDVRDGFAMIEGREGPMSVAPGDNIPGLGRVLRIERRGRQWDVVTSLGVISSEPPPY